jgi:4-diphosphocytidyl-2-C-methyl-D-erythritol kinase
VVLFPNCKINLGLHVIGKRTDGYHDLETIFYPVAVKDALEVIAGKEFTFQLTGLPVDDIHDNNLCVKAYHLLKKNFPDLPAVSVHLHKAIPMGAGLGGGSADGAFMLAMLNKQFQLHLSEEKLMLYALQLGSDCPFFIINQPCFATGRGENLTRVELDLSPYKIVLINPGLHVSTKDAFARLTPATPIQSIRKIIQQPIVTWKNELVNDFEKTVFELYPAVETIKERLYEKGAVYASMTGSGSTVFGIFDKTSSLEFLLPFNYTCLIAQ